MLNWRKLHRGPGVHADGANGDHYWVERVNGDTGRPVWELKVRWDGESRAEVYSQTEPGGTAKSLKAEAQKIEDRRAHIHTVTRGA